MDSPFDETTLLNLTFPAGSWYEEGTENILFGQDQDGFSVAVQPSDSDVTVTAVFEDYQAGYVGNYTYMPVYGRFELSNGDVYYIHAFAEDGSALYATMERAQPIEFPQTYIVLANATLPDGSTGIRFLFDFASSNYVPVCFAEGTWIETANGLVAVEKLSAGDMVATASGAARPVKWIGQMAVRTGFHPRPWEVHPVRVRAHAFGPGVPKHDVRLSPGHAVFVDGVLVPVGHLVNGATIVQEEVAEIRYFHVELESHDLLIADGLPCESYLDDGNRGSFANGNAVADLHGRLDPRNWDNACAPLVAAGPQLVAIQQQLAAQAQSLGWIKREDADLRIEADAVSIAPLHQAGNRYWFATPATAELTLRSGANILAHIMPGIADDRRLGVAVAELRIDGTALDLADAAFGDGFYPPEEADGHGWRWTDGQGRLGHALAAPAMVEVTLVMVAPWWCYSAPALQAAA